jgi:hypothetical protein
MIPIGFRSIQVDDRTENKILMDLQAGLQRLSQENDSGVMITKGMNCVFVIVQIPCYISTTIKPFTTYCEFIVPNMWLPQS